MGRRFRPINTFSPHDSNTICDITGFKVKRSEVMRRWEGFYVIPEAWHPRQPQDTPVIPDPQQVFEDVRIEAEDEVTPESFDPI